MPRLGTFAICGRCAETGALGVAIATRFLAVGALAPNAAAGVGACSSQAFVNPQHRYWMLDYLKEGFPAPEALRRSLSRDPRPQLRQLLLVDAHGNGAAHTGEWCDGWAGHDVGKNYAAGGNMLANGEVVRVMGEAFAATEGRGLPLAERLLRCLRAAQDAGGDKRGKQSAALLVVDTELYPRIDLRVDDHPRPITELHRLYALYRDQFAEILRTLPSRADPAGTMGQEFIPESREEL